MAGRIGVTLLSLVGLLVLPISTPAQSSAILYVNGGDATCGGRSPCFTTIQAAVTVAQAGETVRIQAGTYVEQISVSGKNNTAGATETDRIVIEADPELSPGGVVIDGAVNQCTNGYAVRFQQSKFVTLRGLTITGAGGPAISLMGGNNQNQNIHIELNRIFGNGSGSCNGGITVARGNAVTLIANNLIHANGRNGVTFIDADGGPHYIINNTIYGNQWNGVDVARNHTTTLANNIINNNGTSSGTTGGRFGVRREGSASPQPAGIKLLNNLICGNSQGQITAEVLDATDSSNYTPLGKEGPGVGVLSGCETPANLFTDVAGTDDVENTADDDFSLKPDSLAIDVGMDPRTLGFNPSYDPIFEADFVIESIRPADGNADGIAAFDAGAFEFVSPNGSPVAHAGLDRTVTPGTLVNLDGTASFDPDGNSLTYQWVQTSGLAVALSSPTLANAAFTAPQIQAPIVLVFQLTVSDGFASSSATVRITVETSNSPPVLSPIGNKTVGVGDTLTFTVNAADVDNDLLTYSVAPLPLPAGASFDSATRAFTFTPVESQVGSFNLIFGVSDGRGGTASETITVTVTAGLAIAITSPTNGGTVPAGSLIVRGTVQTSGGEIGVTVNGFPVGVQGNNFTGLISVAPDTTSLTAKAVSPSGATVTHSIAVTVSAAAPSPIVLHTSPMTGAAPLTVEFSLFGEGEITQVTLDADGDGSIDFSATQLAQQLFTFNQPGTYVATAVAERQGVQVAANAVVQVFDPTQLDTVLQARWAAMKDALRVGNIESALNEIVARSRARYEEAFQRIASQLPNIDQILTSPAIVRIGNSSAVYEAARVDDGMEMSFEIRFAIDGDGIWRIEAF